VPRALSVCAFRYDEANRFVLQDVIDGPAEAFLELTNA
jgi:hypothetical protein